MMVDETEINSQIEQMKAELKPMIHNLFTVPIHRDFRIMYGIKPEPYVSTEIYRTLNIFCGNLFNMDFGAWNKERPKSDGIRRMLINALHEKYGVPKPLELVGLSMLLEGTPHSDFCTELIQRAKQKLAQELQVKNPLAKDGEKLEVPAFAQRPVPALSATTKKPESTGPKLKH